MMTPTSIPGTPGSTKATGLTSNGDAVAMDAFALIFAQMLNGPGTAAQSSPLALLSAEQPWPDQTPDLAGSSDANDTSFPGLLNVDAANILALASVGQDLEAAVDLESEPAGHTLLEPGLEPGKPLGRNASDLANPVIHGSGALPELTDRALADVAAFSELSGGSQAGKTAGIETGLPAASIATQNALRAAMEGQGEGADSADMVTSQVDTALLDPKIRQSGQANTSPQNVVSPAQNPQFQPLQVGPAAVRDADLPRNEMTRAEHASSRSGLGSVVGSGIGTATHPQNGGGSWSDGSFGGQDQDGGWRPAMAIAGDESRMAEHAGWNEAEFSVNGASRSGEAQRAGGAYTNSMPQPLAQQLSLHITHATAEGLDRLQVRLAPEELGSVDIAIEMGPEQKTQLTILVERAETLDLLSRDQRQLERLLGSHGLELDGGLQLGLQNERGHNADRQDSHARKENSPSSSNGADGMHDAPALTAAPLIGDALLNVVI